MYETLERDASPGVNQIKQNKWFLKPSFAPQYDSSSSFYFYFSSFLPSVTLVVKDWIHHSENVYKAVDKINPLTLLLFVT